MNKWYAESWDYMCKKYNGKDLKKYLMPIDRRRDPDEGIPGNDSSNDDSPSEVADAVEQ